MKKSLLPIFAIALIIFSCKMDKQNHIPVNYPLSKKGDASTDFFGTTVNDPYQWMEAEGTDDVNNWVDSQNVVTEGYFANIPYTGAIAERLEELLNYPRLSSPYRVGDYYFFYKNDGLQNQSVIYYQKGRDADAEVFIDPNALSAEGTTSINLLGHSEDYKYIAYAKQEAGSDWQTIHVKEIATKEDTPDVMEWVKFSGATWYKDGFFYSRYPAPEKGKELSTDNKHHSVYYHKLGTPQSSDELIYRDNENPTYYNYVSTTEDDKYLILYSAPGTDGYATYYKELGSDGDFKVLFEGYKNKSSVVNHCNGRLLCRTDIDAPNYQLIAVDPNNVSDHETVIAETENLLRSVSTGGGKLYAKYLDKATTRVYQMEYDGGNKKEIQLPGKGSGGGFSGKEEDKTLFYSFTSFVNPPSIFEYNIETGESELFYKAKLQFNPEDYVEKQVVYTSKDGKQVPMFIVHKKGVKMNGSNPCLLYGYGGFNINLTPSFSTSRLLLLENGGVYAQPSLRGGGEFGEEWHKDGMLFKKQNVFDDFIAAGEYLIAECYTNKEKLGISGRSNGGLLVGAAMTQRPDLFKVAFPAVGVMDMLRYHRFSVGKGWIPEYGCADSSKAHFDNLYAYSPLHNIKDGTEYPATMVQTADHDDRVWPAHSFKFAAQLQESHKGDAPVLIRIEKNAGHGAGKPIEKVIEDQAAFYSFFFHNTNSPVKYFEQ